MTHWKSAFFKPSKESVPQVCGATSTPWMAQCPLEAMILDYWCFSVSQAFRAQAATFWRKEQTTPIACPFLPLFLWEREGLGHSCGARGFLLAQGSFMERLGNHWLCQGSNLGRQRVNKHPMGCTISLASSSWFETLNPIVDHWLSAGCLQPLAQSRHLQTSTLQVPPSLPFMVPPVWGMHT